MRKYFLFSIRKEYYDIYYKNQLVLYKTLENLYYLKKENVSFGFPLFKQICNIIDIDRLNSYFEQVCLKKKNNKYLLVYNQEKIIFSVYYPCIVCKTSKNYPFGLKIISYYDRNLFVCDFENKDYFFLDKKGIKT